RLRVDVVCLRRTMDDFHAPETLRALGFDGYALDFVTAPRPVLAALCDRDHLHEVPVALGPVANEQVLAQGLCKQYVAAGTHYSVTRARYGSRAASVTTSRTRPHARLLSADDDEAREARERCSQEMDALRDRLQDNERAMKALAKRDQTARDKHRRLAAQEEQLRAARDAQLAEVRAWERRKIHLESKAAQLESLVAEERRDAPQGAQRERRRIEQQLAENAARRAELLAALAHTLAQSAEALHALALAGLRHVRFQHALSCVRAQAERHRQAAQAARDALDQASDELARAKAHATECLAETRAATEHMDDDERQRVRDAQAQRASATCAEVEAELAALRQRLRMAEHSGLSARVIEEHARREAQLADNRKRRELAAQQLHAVRRKKRRLRAAWEQPLVEIVGGVAASFARMFDAVACAGDVLVRRADDGAVAGELEDSPRDEDYGAWGIEIRVAFRANEALQPLDSHRQSGGERAVATIVYLQALQALVAAPFRVVDEINQGMDPRNERMAHALIVDTACQPDGPQYFLITPKLLPGLAYHPRMTVLCIFNGEWQPESFNPATYIANARSQAAA
ncbi:Structural maintenance of chromosomes protein 5, partial [Coemansia sp. RSA 2603]